MTPDDDAPVRLIARSDAPRRPRSTVDVHCALELELSSGPRGPLLTDRGWSADGTWDLVTVAPADVLGADATAALPTGLAPGLGVAPTAWEDPGVVLAPAADADPELLHGVLLHTTAVVAGPPALVARLADADVSDLLDDVSLGAHLRRPVEDVSAAWLHAADRQALSLDPDGGAAHVARHAELTAVLETRPVVVERVGMRDRDAQRAADAVGLRRVGRERVLRVAAP